MTASGLTSSARGGAPVPGRRRPRGARRDGLGVGAVVRPFARRADPARHRNGPVAAVVGGGRDGLGGEELIAPLVPEATTNEPGVHEHGHDDRGEPEGQGIQQSRLQRDPQHTDDGHQAGAGDDEVQPDHDADDRRARQQPVPARSHSGRCVPRQRSAQHDQHVGEHRGQQPAEGEPVGVRQVAAPECPQQAVGYPLRDTEGVHQRTEQDTERDQQSDLAHDVGESPHDRRDGVGRPLPGDQAEVCGAEDEGDDRFELQCDDRDDDADRGRRNVDEDQRSTHQALLRAGVIR